MVNLILAESWASTNGIWGYLLGLFYNLLHNMGWTIVVFTICLKIVLIPLDIYQRHISAKTTEKQNEMKPELDKINRIYAQNKELLNQKTMEVYKKHNFNLGSSCLGMIINLIITFVVFITLFSSLRVISNQMIAEEFDTLKQTYISVYIEDYDKEYNTLFNSDDALIHTGFDTQEEYAKYYADLNATKEAQQKVYDKYQEIKESWLWIKNIYLTDTAVNPFPSFDKYVANAGLKFDDGYTPISNIIDGSGTKITDKDSAKARAEEDYNLVSKYIQEKVAKQWNGYYILIILAGLITWGSTQISKLGQPKQIKSVQLANGQTVQKEMNPMGMMSWMLPALMVFFTWSYTGLFAIYVVINSICSVMISLGIYLIKTKIIKPNKKTNSKNKTTQPPEIKSGSYTMRDK